MKTKGQHNADSRKDIQTERIRMNDNRWTVNGFEIRHMPKVGWLVCKQGEVLKVVGSVPMALKEVLEEEER